MASDMEGIAPREFFSVEAEQSVLGGLLLDNLAWDRIADIVREQDFFSRDHRMIFRAIARQCEVGRPADIVTVAEFLDTHKALEEAGGIAYLGSLVQNIPSAANVRRYAEIVRKYALLRLIATTAREVSEKIYSRGDMEPRDLLDFAQSRFMNISETAAKSGSTIKNMPEVMDAVLYDIEQMRSNPRQSDITGLPSGIYDLDRMTSGLQPGELVILAARPSMGKTSLALNIVEHVALEQKKNVAVFSLEMINAQLGTRLIYSDTQINQQRVRIGRHNDYEFREICKAAQRLRKSGIFLDEESNLSAVELRARARRIHRECGALHLIVIDYIGLMALSGKTDNRAIEIAEISRALKLLAKELHVPVLVLSQLNRGLEQRPNKRPIMSDLRDSGGLEQDADAILFIYRDEVYNQDSPDQGYAEIIVGKQRNGPIGTVHTTFKHHLMRFDNLPTGGTLPSALLRQEKKSRRAGNFHEKNEDEDHVEM